MHYTLLQSICLVQGCFYLLTGLWPLVNMRSFVAVTGPKHDLWLVKTAGALIAVAGTALCVASRGAAVPVEVWVLGSGSAMALLIVDVVYVARRVISRIYLADAAAEAAIISTWVVAIGRFI